MITLHPAFCDYCSTIEGESELSRNTHRTTVHQVTILYHIPISAPSHWCRDQEHASTYSLSGCHWPCLTLGPLLGGGGDTSTTSRDGGGISTTSGDNCTSMTSSSLQKTKSHRLTQYTPQYSAKLKSYQFIIIYTSQTCWWWRGLQHYNRKNNK